MSLNTLQMGPDLTPPLLPGENLIDPPHLTPGFQTDMELRIPATMEGPKRSVAGQGRIWITDQRVIYISSNAPLASSSTAPPIYTNSKSEEVHSLIIPYSTTISCTYHLPTFSSNHLILSFQPDPLSTSLPSAGRGGKYELKLTVGMGQSHNVWKRIEGERERFKERRVEEETLPVYTANPTT